MGDLFLENNFDQYIDELDSVIFPAQSYALHEQEIKHNSQVKYGIEQEPEPQSPDVNESTKEDMFQMESSNFENNFENEWKNSIFDLRNNSIFEQGSVDGSSSSRSSSSSSIFDQCLDRHEIKEELNPDENNDERNILGKISEDDLRFSSLKRLKQIFKEQNCTEEEKYEMKKRRRRLRNRGYTANCRRKKAEQVNLLIEEIEKYKKAFKEQKKINLIQKSDLSKMAKMATKLQQENEKLRRKYGRQKCNTKPKKEVK